MMDDAEMVGCGDKSRQLERLRAIMHRLRAPGGCPWDAEQTHASLVSNLIEEAWEAVDAIRRDDHEHLREELGDLLLQVVFHAELAEEAGRFDLDEVARGICEKLVRRHPHVFGDSAAEGSEAVLRQWDEIKRAEKGGGERAHLDGVGGGLPELMRAAKLQKKAARVGFDWPDEAGVRDKIREELSELDEALACGDPDAAASELGDLMFSLVNLARTRRLDPEALMAAANDKFARRFTAMERALQAAGRSLEEAELAEMESAWQAAKAQD